MNNQFEALFTTALGLQATYVVVNVALNTGERRIDIDVAHGAGRPVDSVCSKEHPPIHDRVRRSWRHPDFFQYEAWLHSEVPCLRSGGYGTTKCQR